jgi:hypothetical protein
VFIIVAVDAQIFPVRPVHRIVVMVPVFVVYREQVPRLEIELPGALGTNEAMNLQGLFPVGTMAGGGRFRSQFLENLVNRFVNRRFLKAS